MRSDSSTRSWNLVADDWVAHADLNDYRNFFLMPRTLEMLGEVGGRRILDLGCGEGGYARELARRGAEVTAIDGSPRLIEVAQQRTQASGLNVVYICANASHLGESGIEPASFDLVLAAMSLMDVEDYPGAIREVHRTLRPAGELIMSITHPCFSAPLSEWAREGRHELRHFMVDRYFERIAWETKIAAHFSNAVLRRHRPLEDFMLPPIASGFELRDFCEALPKEEELRHSPRFRKLLRIPYFLFLRWRKKT